MQRYIPFIKTAIFLLSLIPFVLLVLGAINNTLGTNPVEAMTHDTGQWSLRFLLITLCVTPLRQLTGAAWLIRFRRMLGLFAFFYASLHFITYIWLDQFFDWTEILKDIPKRPFITVGFIAFVLLIPLAATSTNGMMRRLGKNWKKLHRLAYVVPLLAILHLLWVVKADTLEPLVYFSILMLLLFQRVYQVRKTRRVF